MTVYGCEATASAKKGEKSEEDTFNKLVQTESQHRKAEKTEAREEERGQAGQ